MNTAGLETVVRLYNDWIVILVAAADIRDCLKTVAPVIRISADQVLTGPAVLLSLAIRLALAQPSVLAAAFTATVVAQLTSVRTCCSLRTLLEDECLRG